MKRGRKTLLILVISYIVLLIGFFIHQAFFVPQREVIPSLMNSWDFLNTIIRVLAWAPALTGTTILLVFGLIPDSGKEGMGRQSYLKKLRGPLMVVGISSFVYAIFVSWALPAAQGECARILSVSRTFNAEIQEAEASLKAGDWKGAALHISVAKAIDDHDKRFVSVENIYLKDHPSGAAETPEKAAPGLSIQEEQSATRYYEQALQAFERKEFYLAHSLATRSFRIDHRREEAQRLASKAWDQIAVLGDSAEALAQRKFALAKQDAYKALQAGDFISAYGQFLDLQRTAPKDPDVVRYLEESLAGVRSISFFQDEVNKLSLYPASDEVFFRAESAGNHEVFFAARRFYLGPEIAYAKDFEYMVVDDGVLTLHIVSPFAKFQGTRILLAAYDREKPSNGILPTFKAGGDPKRIQSYQDSPLDIDGLRTAIAATRSPANQDAISLFTCIRRASAFGLDPQPFMREAFDRARIILGFLTLCVFALFLGYRFRYRGDKPPVLELVIAAPMAWFASNLAFQAWENLNGLWLDLSLSFAPALSVIIFSLVQATTLGLAFLALAGHRDRPSD